MRLIRLFIVVSYVTSNVDAFGFVSNGEAIEQSMTTTTSIAKLLFPEAFITSMVSSQSHIYMRIHMRTRTLCLFNINPFALAQIDTW